MSFRREHAAYTEEEHMWYAIKKRTCGMAFRREHTAASHDKEVGKSTLEHKIKGTERRGTR
jgi:hypothetical protein